MSSDMFEYNYIDKGEQGIDFLNYSFEDELKKYEGVKPVGYEILVRVYVPKRAEKVGSIYLADTTADKLDMDAKFGNLTGLVLKFGPGVYKDEERYKYTGPYCKIGDWIQFQRADGHSFAMEDNTTLYIKEDRIVGVVDDPRKISRIK